MMSQEDRTLNLLNNQVLHNRIFDHYVSVIALCTLKNHLNPYLLGGGMLRRPASLKSKMPFWALKTAP